MSLTKEQILQADDIKTERIEVPEWGGTVFVKMMSGAERDAFEASIIVGQRTDLQNIRAKLCARTIVDSNGKRLFADKDIAALAEKSATVLDRIFTVAQKLNRLTAEDTEELVKNSGRAPSADSDSS